MISIQIACHSLAKVIVRVRSWEQRVDQRPNRTCAGWEVVESSGVCMGLITVHVVYTEVKRRVWTEIKQSVYWLGYGLDAWEISVRFSAGTRELGLSLLQIAENGYGRDPKVCSVANNGSSHRDQSGRRYEATHSPPSRAEGKNKWSYPSITAHTHPRFWLGVRSRPRAGSEKSGNTGRTPPPQTMFQYVFSVFVFLQKHCDERCFFFPLNSLNI